MAGIKFSCPHCSQRLESPEAAAGAMLPCPNCGREIQVPVPAPATAIAGGAKCGICLSAINDAEARAACPACRAEYHAECWQENGGCAIYGCSQVPVVEKRPAIEIPMSYWGQENKQCPSCQREILAAAVRCRHCGATFESAQPQDAEEFRQRTELSGRLPAVRRKVIALFILCVLPCLAPVGAVWGLLWYPGNREDVRALPSLYGALCRIGLIVGIGQTVAVVLLTILFALVRG
jgi:hypothetical protein